MNIVATRPRLTLLVLCPALACPIACSSVDESSESLAGIDLAATTCVVPSPNLDITKSTTLCPGSYVISDPEGDGAIRIRANNVELTISGVTLTGTGIGYGVAASGKNGVTVKSSASQRGKIRNYRSAVMIEGGAGHRILENVLSSNTKRALTHTDADFLGVWEEWEGQLSLDQIGNGVVLRNVTSATVTNNQMRLQQNGIGLFSSSNVTISGNDCSDNQGWGIHLHRSSNNQILNNRADNVHLAASSYCHDVQSDACDTAGILVIKASNSNRIQGNSFKNGGDGIFSAARQGDIQHGADHNRYIGNDVSQAKHLGIEATFAHDITVENNIVVGAGRSGIWLGGSTNSIVRGNTIAGSGWSGIENEGAHHFTIENNVISGSAQHGILLRGASFGPSSDYFIARNTITGNGEYGIRAEDTHAITATGNELRENAHGSIELELRNESAWTGPIVVNESRLLDATEACGGVNVECGCRVFNGDVEGCNAAGCAYYACSDRCEPQGTSLCDGGCAEECTGSCSDHDGNVEACDAAGGCAYYFCSNRCYAAGTDIGVACSCRHHAGAASVCAATPGCEFYACSNQCHFEGTSECNAGCAESCGATEVSCPVDDVVTVTSNYWGTTDPSVIDAAICGATLAFVPFKTSP
jgi:parallel beta-helix repeat protein